MEHIGLIGAGVMGTTVAPRITAAGYPLVVYDPYPPALERVAACGAIPLKSPAEIGEKSDIVILFLPGPAEVEQCVAGEGGLLSTLKAGSVIVDMSTIDPGTTRKMAPVAAARGVSYIDAPVLGRPATVGHWALPVGGEARDIERCTPLFQCFAARVIHVGPHGSGNTIKLLNQLMFGAINAMTAEMMAVAEKAGVAPKLLYETITASQAGTVSNLFKELGRRVADEDYGNATFNVNLLCKDVRLAVEMARAAGAPPLLGSTIQFMNEAARAQGYGTSDTAVMWKSILAMWDCED